MDVELTDPLGGGGGRNSNIPSLSWTGGFATFHQLLASNERTNFSCFAFSLFTKNEFCKTTDRGVFRFKFIIISINYGRNNSFVRLYNILSNQI